MIIQSEPLKACTREMDALLHEYWDATEAHVGTPPLDMDWDFYAMAAHQGKLVVITAREGAEMVGFAMYHILQHPHHKGMTYAGCDILAVKLGQRGKGIGTKLVTAAEPLLKMFYVKQILHGFRPVYAAEPLFPKLGFTLVEQVYMKAVK